MDDRHKCIHCKTKLVYSDDYDSYYCPKCLYWTEHICPDRKCMFCKNRPKYPFDDIKNTKKRIVSGKEKGISWEKFKYEKKRNHTGY